MLLTALIAVIYCGGCRKDLRIPGYSYYVSYQTEIVDPATGAREIVKHSEKERIVIRIGFDEITVLDPSSEVRSYDYIGVDQKDVSFCDSMTRVVRFFITDGDQMYSCYRKTGLYSSDYCFLFVQRGQEDQIDCNRLTFFNYSYVP